MREYDDDDNIKHYAPVLRRIIILVAVITAVPVMLWTITAFMHTYIAQPTIPSPQPLAAATATVTPSADSATANPPAPAAAPSQPSPAPTDARATDDGRGDRMRDSAGNTGAPNVQVAALAQHRPPHRRLRRLQPPIRRRPRLQHPRRAFSRTRHLSRSQRLPRWTQMMPMPCRRRIRSLALFLCRGIVQT